MKNEKELSAEQLKQVQGAGLAASKAQQVSALEGESKLEEGKIVCPAAERTDHGGQQIKP